MNLVAQAIRLLQLTNERIKLSVNYLLLKVVTLLLDIIFCFLTCNVALVLHAGGAVAMAYMMLDSWPSYNYWYIFGFTDALPAVTEILCFLLVLCCGKLL